MYPRQNDTEINTFPNKLMIDLAFHQANLQIRRQNTNLNSLRSSEKKKRKKKSRLSTQTLVHSCRCHKNKNE